MIEVTNNIEIDRPVDDVYAFVLDGTNNQLWRTSITDVQRIAGKPHSYKMGMTGPGGRNDADYEVVEQKPNELLVMRGVAGMVRPTGRFTFEPLGASSRVTFTLTLNGRGPARLMEPIAEPIMRKEVGMLVNLKQYLEVGPSTDDSSSPSGSAS